MCVFPGISVGFWTTCGPAELVDGLTDAEWRLVDFGLARKYTDDTGGLVHVGLLMQV